MQWPADADGDVFRGLVEREFDFTAERELEFMVDFETWPPPVQAVAILSDRFTTVRLFEPENGSEGYAVGTLPGVPTYELVTKVQSQTSSLMQPFGGVCEAWGLLV